MCRGTNAMPMEFAMPSTKMARETFAGGGSTHYRRPSVLNKLLAGATLAWSVLQKQRNIPEILTEQSTAQRRLAERDPWCMVFRKRFNTLITMPNGSRPREAFFIGFHVPPLSILSYILTTRQKSTSTMINIHIAQLSCRKIRFRDARPGSSCKLYASK